MPWFSRRIVYRKRVRRTVNHLGFEQLESRELLAVTTSLTGGVLTISGDIADDSIRVVGTGVGGELSITGRNDAFGNPTLVNGTPNGTVTIPGVNSDLIINLSEGNNTLELDNVLIAGRINITGGTAFDQFLLGVNSIVSCSGDLNVVASNGGNFVKGLNLYIGGNATFTSGQDDDTFAFYNAAAPGVFQLSVSTTQGVIIASGGGNDTVIVNYAFVGNFTTIDSGAGNDAVRIFGSNPGTLSIAAGDGLDGVTVDANFFNRDTTIRGEGGSDRLSVFGNRQSQFRSSIDGGAGSDLVEVRNQLAGEVRITSGVGSDSVDVRGSLMQILFADLGDQDDVITLFGNTIGAPNGSGVLYLNGGTGFDQFANLGNVFPLSVSWFNFELFL
jgi:large repetitive protein